MILKGSLCEIASPHPLRGSPLPEGAIQEVSQRVGCQLIYKVYKVSSRVGKALLLFCCR